MDVGNGVIVGTTVGVCLTPVVGDDTPVVTAIVEVGTAVRDVVVTVCSAGTLMLAFVESRPGRTRKSRPLRLRRTTRERTVNIAVLRVKPVRLFGVGGAGSVFSMTSGGCVPGKGGCIPGCACISVLSAVSDLGCVAPFVPFPVSSNVSFPECDGLGESCCVWSSKGGSERVVCA